MIINTIANPFGKLFYLATNLSKQGRINEEEKGKLKGIALPIYIASSLKNFLFVFCIHSLDYYLLSPPFTHNLVNYFKLL